MQDGRTQLCQGRSVLQCVGQAGCVCRMDAGYERRRASGGRRGCIAVAETKERVVVMAVARAGVGLEPRLGASARTASPLPLSKSPL